MTSKCQPEDFVEVGVELNGRVVATRETRTPRGATCASSTRQFQIHFDPRGMPLLIDPEHGVDGDWPISTDMRSPASQPGILMQRGALCVPQFIRQVGNAGSAASGLARHSGRVSVTLNHLRLTSSVSKMSYSIVERGKPNTLGYRIFYQSPDGQFLSPFHDIPLFPDPSDSSVLNMVVEIPRWTNAKMEISKDEKLNPIKQDVKKGKLRFVKNIFPHHGYIWNYGAHPQTWEDPEDPFEETGTKGDNDPLDVCEIGQKVHARGAVIQVKVLGCMLLIDEGETDWKIIAIDVSDPLAPKLNDIDDIDREMPGFLRATYEWFRYYKVPDGKPENKVHWDGSCKDKKFAMDVIQGTHNQWKQLMLKDAPVPELSRINTTFQECPDVVSRVNAESVVQASEEPGPAAEIESEVDKWHYVIPKEQLKQ